MPPSENVNDEPYAIDHTQRLSKSLGSLLATSYNSDVVFIVEGQRFSAHRLLLAMQSVVFREMLLGEHFRESLNKDEPIPLPGKRAASFDAFLKYIYTGLLNLAAIELDTCVDILLIAHEFQVTSLVDELSLRLTKQIDFESVVPLFEAALVLEASSLLKRCQDFMCKNGRKLLQLSCFTELSPRALIDLLSCDEFGASEFEILQAVAYWYSRNTDANIKQVIELTIRFELVDVNGMSLAVLAPLFQLFAIHNIDVAQLAQKHQQAPRYRRFLEVENQALPEHGATILRDGEVVNPFYMIDGTFLKRSCNFTIQGYETHHLHGADSFILLKLGKVCYVDSLLFVAANHSLSSYVICSHGFRIETSTDNQNWQILAESGDFLAVQRRLLSFPARHVRYIKLTGKAMRAFHAFFVLHLECPATSVKVSDVKALYSKADYPSDSSSVVMYELEQKRAIVLA